MKAAIFERVNEPMKIQDIELADPRGREILVRTVAAGICHSDLLFYEGGWEHKLPTILGHEVSGVVERVGSDVTTVKVTVWLVDRSSASIAITTESHLNLLASHLKEDRFISTDNFQGFQK